MKIRTRISLITTLSLVICCISLWCLNFASTSHMVKSIKRLDTVDVKEPEENKKTARLVAIEDKENKNELRFLISLVFVITIGTSLSYFALKRALKPFSELNKVLQDFKTSDLKTPLLLPKVKDESYELISSYNMMLNRLNDAFEREKRITANIAHEFKTPLSVLLTKCEVLELKEDATIEDYKKVIDIIKAKTEYLSNVTSSILSIHRETQKVNDEKCNIEDILQGIVEDLHDKLLEKNIEITVKTEKTNIFVDHLLFCQMLNNFIENAIKYNTENGKIAVKSYTKSSLLYIEIRDTGIGIPESSKNLLFEPFYRVDESRNKEYGGVGLGLSFAKVVANIYSGVIQVENNKPKGTCFVLCFPNIIA